MNKDVTFRADLSDLLDDGFVFDPVLDLAEADEESIQLYGLIHFNDKDTEEGKLCPLAEEVLELQEEALLILEGFLTQHSE